jgi:hypothetical protein
VSQWPPYQISVLNFQISGTVLGMRRDLGFRAYVLTKPQSYTQPFQVLLLATLLFLKRSPTVGGSNELCDAFHQYQAFEVQQNREVWLASPLNWWNASKIPPYDA